MRKSVPDFESVLKENAKDSLIHGVEHYLSAVEKQSASEFKFTILHVFHALELYLKARLAHKGAALLFEKEDAPVTEESKTVGAKRLLKRLESVGVKISDEAKDDFESLRLARNEIEHLRMDFSIEAAQEYVGRAMRFLEQFLKAELDYSLEEHMSEADYMVLVGIVHSFEERAKRANVRVNEAIPYQKKPDGWEIVECPTCQTESIAYRNCYEGEIKCHFCVSSQTVQSCPRCGQPVFVSGDDDDFNLYCESCEENYLGDDG